MRHVRFHPRSTVVRAAVVSVLLSAGLAFGLTGSAQATPAHATPRHVAPPRLVSIQMVAFDCPGQQTALVKPRSFVIACADGNSGLGRLSWTSWTSSLASATGMVEENDCIPYCAAGHFRSYPAVVVFWGSTAVKNHPGERAYTKMTIVLTGTRPRYYDYLTRTWVTAPATQTSALWTTPGAISPVGTTGV